MNKIQRQLRRIPLIRSLLLADAKRVRESLRLSNWKYRHSILAGLGQFVSTFSGIERQLDTLIVQYHAHRAENIGLSKLPTQVTQKIEYLRAMATDERLPEIFRKNLKEWADEIAILVKYRNLMVHGNLRHKSPHKLEWEVQKLKLKGYEHTFELHRFSDDELRYWNWQAFELHQKMAVILRALLFPDNGNS